MIVTIKSEVFNDSKNDSDLNDLMHFFRKGRHRLYLKKAIDFEAFEKSKWKERLSKSDVDILKEGIGRIDKKEIVVTNKSNEVEFNLKEAYAYLQQPLSIIVENYEYEPAFVNCIFKNFGDDLLIAKNKHWLKFENGGGANDNTIKGMLKELFNDSIFTKSKEKYLRCYVIKDSDREYCIINQNNTITEQNLPVSKIEFLERNKIPYHILYKREKENYMPDKVFNSFIQTAKRNDKKKEFAISYLKLTHHQKDFFDIEKGFSIKAGNGREINAKAKLKPEIQRLYDNLSDEDYRKIGLGFEIASFKSEFSNHFGEATREDLEKRILHQSKLVSKVNTNDTTERNEFDHIINEIKYLL